MNGSDGAAELTVPVLGLLTILVGVTLVLVALAHQDPANPLRPTLNPRKWKPVWLQGDHFTSQKQLSAYVLGFHFICGGALLDFAYLLLR